MTAVTNKSVEGVYNLLLNINPHKTCGPDQIHERVLNETADVVSPFLQTLFQSSLDSGVIPDDWQSTNITLNSQARRLTAIFH